MSRPGVVPVNSCRSRHQQPMLDIGAPPPTLAELTTDAMRVKARLAERAAVDVERVKARLAERAAVDVMRVKARLAERADVDVMRVKARLAQRAADKVSAANVATKRQEVPRVPRVARQQWQHVPTLESKESSLKGTYHRHPTFQPHRLPWHVTYIITAIRHIVPARSDKSRAVQSVQPRNELAGRCLTPRTKDTGEHFHYFHTVDDC